jgi:hypothetical protein
VTTNISFDQVEFTELLRKLDGAGLDEKEKGLLSVMMSIALEVIETREVRVDFQPAFSDQFANAFTPAKRQLLSRHAQALADGTATSFGITCVVTNGTDGITNEPCPAPPPDLD